METTGNLYGTKVTNLRANHSLFVNRTDSEGVQDASN